METPKKEKIEEVVDIAILNLIFSGLSFEQIGKLPDWLLKNIEKNKPEFKTSLHTSLVAAVEGKKPKIKSQDFSLQGIYNEGYEQAKSDTITIINSIFKE